MKGSNAWLQLIKRNFENAATQYNSHAELQRSYAFRLAEICKDYPIPNGIWADLGSGTGLLADALEKNNPKQSVIRIDNSDKMLSQNNSNSPHKLWDLNLGLPKLPQKPTLLASSFALHWLQSPEYILKEWFNALPIGGWLAVVVPINGCFPEWQIAAQKAKVSFTALPLPNPKNLLSKIPPCKIKYNQIENFTQKSEDAIDLLKPIAKAGAHSTLNKSIHWSELKSLLSKWPSAKVGEEFSLTWRIQLLLINK